MGYIINLKADTGLVDRSENTTRFYRDIKDYRTFDIEEEKRWFTKLKLAKEFAKFVLCLNNKEENCNCKSCLCYDGNNHPDFSIVNERTEML